ncbi:MAG: hypothetical protein J6W51_00950 [Fibrobacter sp.]|nr:hypothetical protein [Fibrobacter sp.]MBP5767674.1 hypothetical protein [Fibrobacter sp.]
MRIGLIFILLSVCIAAAAPAKKSPSKNKFKDPRDGHTYRIVKIGNHNWLAENLTYKTRGSYCYNDDNDNCHKYGRLYTWKAAMNACPTGWRLPDRKDWNFLSKYLGASKKNGFRVKQAGQRICFGNNEMWSPYCEATKSSFNVPGQNDAHFAYEDMDKSAFFWTATEETTYIANFVTIGGYNERYAERAIEENNAFSVRCIQK